MGSTFFFGLTLNDSRYLKTANVIETQFMVPTEYVEMFLGYLTVNINCFSLRFVY